MPDASGGYVLDGTGRLHGFALGAGPVPPPPADGPTWARRDLARGVALGSKGGYVLDSSGGLHPFSTRGPKPALARGGFWQPGRDLARGVALLPDASGGYVLDAYGGIHPFAAGDRPVPPPVVSAAYWPGLDLARGIALLPGGRGGHVLDAYGGLHPFAVGAAPVPPRAAGPYSPGRDIVRGLSFLADGTGGFEVDPSGALRPVTPCANCLPRPRPLRAAFYYPWFPEQWRQAGLYPFTRFEPSLGYYDSGDRAVVERHVASMRHGGISVGISAGWGASTPPHVRLPTLLEAGRAAGFRWATYYEEEGYADPLVDRLRADLEYLRDRYAADPAYWKVDGRFVVFVYADPADTCGMAERWAQANATVGAYVVMKIFRDWPSCSSLAPSWHQYGPGAAAVDVSPYSYTVSPGFFGANEAAPRLERDLARWNRTVRLMVASGAAFQLVTTFNEWGEGSSVEPSPSWASPSGHGAYLDALHDNGVE